MLQKKDTVGRLAGWIDIRKGLLSHRTGWLYIQKGFDWTESLAVAVLPASEAGRIRSASVGWLLDCWINKHQLATISAWLHIHKFFIFRIYHVNSYYVFFKVSQAVVRTIIENIIMHHPQKHHIAPLIDLLIGWIAIREVPINWDKT